MWCTLCMKSNIRFMEIDRDFTYTTFVMKTVFKNVMHEDFFLKNIFLKIKCVLSSTYWSKKTRIFQVNYISTMAADALVSVLLWQPYYSLFWCWRRNIPAFGVNAMPAYALAPKVPGALADTILVVLGRHYVLLFQSKFHLLVSSQIQDMIQNMNIYFVIFEIIQHVKS